MVGDPGTGKKSNCHTGSLARDILKSRWIMGDQLWCSPSMLATWKSCIICTWNLPSVWELRKWIPLIRNVQGDSYQSKLDLLMIIVLG